MVELQQERNFVRILPRDRAKHTQSRGDGITSALDSELHDVFGIEVHRIGGERCARRVFDALIDRQD